MALVTGHAIYQLATYRPSTVITAQPGGYPVRTTSFDFDSPEARFKVLINDEEQHSLWPADLPVPGGWAETGVCAAKEDCDTYLEETWTDMRPKSLRILLDGEKGDSGGESV
jgi:MbtH protein